MADDFVPGLALARRYYREAVAPVLHRSFPGLEHAAALIGPGSEVLGFDTARSTDHNWGPRLQLFLADSDAERYGAEITDVLADRLPPSFLGYPTHLERAGPAGERQMRFNQGRLHHGVEAIGLGDWLADRLGFDPRAETTVVDWLSTPGQLLAETTGGAVFHDGPGVLMRVRQSLAWYPDDVWRYLLACQWRRISHEEAFTGRCDEVGDALGAAVTAGRSVRDLMRLCLLMARRYPPYAKWLGSAFAQLPCAPTLAPILSAAVAATSRADREDRLAAAYEAVAGQHNALGLTAAVETRTRPYHDRPYRVLHAERFADALLDSVSDSTVRALPPVGGVDQVFDSADVLCHRDRRRAAAAALFPHRR